MERIPVIVRYEVEGIERRCGFTVVAYNVWGAFKPARDMMAVKRPSARICEISATGRK